MLCIVLFPLTRDKSNQQGTLEKLKIEPAMVGEEVVRGKSKCKGPWAGIHLMSKDSREISGGGGNAHSEVGRGQSTGQVDYGEETWEGWPVGKALLYFLRKRRKEVKVGANERLLSVPKPQSW
jgi:hypothetical protein